MPGVRACVVDEAEALDPFPEHVDARSLVAYHEGDLSGPEADAVRDHLVACSVCAGLLLDLDAGTEFAPDEPTASASGEDGAVDFERAALWHRVRSEVETDAPTVGVPADEPASRNAVRGTIVPWLLAASLLVATGLLFVRARQLDRTVGDLRATVAEFQTPRVDVPILYLDTLARSDGPTARLVAPPDAPFVILILTPLDPERSPLYRVVVEGRDSGSKLDIGPLEPNELGTLRLALPTSSLPPGHYQVSLIGSDSRPGDTRPIDSYAIVVAEP